MGKGDKKSKRGKIVNGSYGVKRPRNKYYYEDEVVEEKPAKKAKKYFFEAENLFDFQLFYFI